LHSRLVAGGGRKLKRDAPSGDALVWTGRHTAPMNTRTIAIVALVIAVIVLVIVMS
jgi:hypothetical protein